MYKKLSILALGLVALVLSACIDLTEIITLNKNGSGDYQLSYDFGSLMTDPMMKSMLAESMNGGEDEEGEATLSDMDTLIRLNEANYAHLEHPEIWKSLTLHMVMDQSKSIFKMDIKFAFNSVKDIEYLMSNISALEGAETSNLDQFSALMPGGPVFELSKNTLKRSAKPSEGMEEDENMAMLEMFLSDAKYTTIYNLPGKVSKAKIAGAEVDGNTVTVQNSLLDVMKGKAEMSGSIKFK